MIYLVVKNGAVIAHTNLDAMKRIESVNAPDMTVSETEWEQAGGIARIVGGEIVLGKTPAETAAENAQKRILEIESELAALDLKSGRAARAVSFALASGNEPEAGDVERLLMLETEASHLRSELQALNN